MKRPPQQSNTSSGPRRSPRSRRGLKFVAIRAGSGSRRSRRSTQSSSSEPRPTARRSAHGISAVGLASEASRKKAVARLPLVLAVVNREAWQSFNAAVTEVVATMRDYDGGPLTQSSLRRWVRDYEQDHDANVLVRRGRSDFGTRRVLRTSAGRGTPRSDEIDEMLRDVLLTKRGSANAAWVALTKRWPRAAFKRQTVYRWSRRWKQENPQLLQLAIEGTGRFHDKSGFHLGWSPVAPLTMHALDSTLLDLWVRVDDPEHPTGFRVVRTWVSLMLDVGSRAAITFEVTLRKPTAGSMLSLLRRAWVPGENWQGLRTVPLPLHVRVDAGAEHKGAFQDALRPLGLDKRVVAGPSERQAHIERAVHTVFGQLAIEDELGDTNVDRAATATDLSSRDHARGRKAAAAEPLRTERDPVDFKSLDELIEHLREVLLRYNARRHDGLVQEAYDQRAAARAAARAA